MVGSDERRRRSVGDVAAIAEVGKLERATVADEEVKPVVFVAAWGEVGEVRRGGTTIGVLRDEGTRTGSWRCDHAGRMGRSGGHPVVVRRDAVKVADDAR